MAAVEAVGNATSPETRSLKQATYTPIENSPKVANNKPGFVPKKPFYKQVILTSILNDPQLGKLVIEELTGKRSKQASKDTVNQDIAEAVKNIWEGNISSAARILEAIDIDKVIKFAKDAISEESSLLDMAKQDLDKAIASIVKNGSDKKEDTSKSSTTTEDNKPDSGRYFEGLQLSRTWWARSATTATSVIVVATTSTRRFWNQIKERIHVKI